jgi:flagellar hook assembly protein FlgD
MVVWQRALPSQAAGKVTIQYYGYGGNGNRVPAGQYPVLIVASKAHGSYVARAVLKITG